MHIRVGDLEKNVRFYSALFGVAPTIHKPDYAKWMLDDPRVNFAISTHGPGQGLDHVGIQVDNDEELDAMRGQLVAADAASVEHEQAACCYATSKKYWVQDPQGIAWEAYHTLGSSLFSGTARQLLQRVARSRPAPVAHPGRFYR